MARVDRGQVAIEPPYDRCLNGVLKFSNLSEAEETLRSLKELRQHFRQAGDKKGIEYCFLVARLGRRRCELISRNTRVSSEKRLEKKEIAFWFKVWLETPELFDDWLLLRKQSEEFRKLGNSNPATP